MKRLSQAVVLVSLSIALPAVESSACGDKFLVIGRATRRVEKAKNPASILLVLREDARLAAAVRAMKLEATLKLAGHSVETMPDSASLAEWLATRRVDFIVTSLEGAAATVRDSASAASRPAVIPVTLDVTGPARAAAEKTYGLVIPAPSKSRAYLSALDAAMGRRRSIASR